MDHPKRINEVKWPLNVACEFLSVAGNKLAIQAENIEPLLGNLKTFLRKLDPRILSASSRKVRGICSYSAADLQDAPSLPALELCEVGNVWLNEILALFDLVEVFARAKILWRVPYITRPPVPIFPHIASCRPHRKILLHGLSTS